MRIAILLIAYGVLNVLGGTLAFVRAKRKAPLVVGGFAGGVLIVCGALAWAAIQAAAYIGLAMTLLLAALYGMRYTKTKKIAVGFLFVVSILAALTLGYFIFA